MIRRLITAPLITGLLITTLYVSGCSMVSGHRKPDGTIVVTSWRFLWKSEAIVFSLASPTNFSAQLSIGKSVTDAQAVGAVTEGVVRALTRP